MTECIESHSHIALAQLAAKEMQVQFAFIDGWHTFDHALTDFFNVDKILSVDGVVAFDDVFFPGVHEACRYVATNRAYRVIACTDRVEHYRPSKRARVLRRVSGVSANARKLLRTKFVVTDESLGFTPDCRCVAFEKVADDTREWDEHHQF